MFNEITPKKSLHECFERLTEYEKGYIQHIRDSFVIEQKLDPSKSEYSQKVLVSYSFDCVNVNKILDYLATYFDLFGYRLNFHIICGFSRDIMNIAIHKTARSRDFDLIPADVTKLEEEKNKEEYDCTITTAEEDEWPTNFRLMTAEEAREKYKKLLDDNEKNIELHLSKINDAIEDAINKGSRIATYKFGDITNFEIAQVEKRLKKYGYTVAYTSNPDTDNPDKHDFENYIITIEF